MTAPCEPVAKCHALRMATICSGIGAPEVASIGLDFDHIFMSEIEPFPSAVLAHHWPHVPNLGDMTKIDGEAWSGQVDVLVGGTPCQAFSVAGKRESLNDERGNLTLKFVELCDAINPSFVVWENVPGVLSTADNAFGCFLGALSGNDGELFPAGQGWSNAGCVIGPRRKLAWRILDAQYFGLAQRRRRVFVVACPRDGADPCEILFEREGLQRHSAPSREKGEGASPTIRAGAQNGGAGHGARSGDSNDELITPVCMAHGQGNAEIVSDGDPSLTCNHEAPIAFHPTQDPIHSSNGSCHALGCGSSRGAATHAVCFGGDIARTLSARHDSSPCADRGMDVVAFHQNQRAEVTLNDTAGSLKVGGGKPGKGDSAPCVAFPIQECHVSRANIKGTGTGLGGESDPMFTLQSAQPHGVATAMQVRRLTPVECERLQGFPDGYTAIPWRNKPAGDCPDGPRYKALGNSMAVPVVRWILSRLEAQHEGE